MAEMRTFIAVEVSSAICERLTALQDALRAADAAVAWVRPAGLHLTLKFLGNVAEDRLPAIGNALAAAAARHAPITLRLAGVGGFPTARRPRVVWAGVAEGAEPLAALAAEVEDALAARGIPREERPFHPHITLGRVKAPQGLDRLATALATHADDALGAMTATTVTLLRSDLSPQGAHYTPLRQAPLGG